MSEILSQLGINWKLLLSQGVNFFIVFGILTVFVWRPLLAIMQERKRQIDAGLENAREIEWRLKEIEAEREAKTQAAERRAIEIITSAEKKAEERFSSIVDAAEKKAAEAIEQGLVSLEKKREEELSNLTREAHSLLREALAKAVMTEPSAIDENLIRVASDYLKKEIRV